MTPAPWARGFVVLGPIFSDRSTQGGGDGFGTPASPVSLIPQKPGTKKFNELHFNVYF